MKKAKAIPDAWDEDYETIADGTSTTSQAAPEVKISRAERKAQHAEANRQLWESAEKLETFHFVETRNAVPLKSDFKPQMKVLSRKPKPPTTTTGSNTFNGVGTGDLEEDDSEEEARKAQQATLLERQQKAQQEREEKQRKYAEVRERLFGSTATPANDSSSGRSSPTNRGGRTRASRGNRRGGADVSGRNSQSASSVDHSPARPTSQPVKELYDPAFTPKPRPILLQKRDSSSTSDLNQPIRHPKGPDGSGRGGFGFAPRGGKANTT